MVNISSLKSYGYVHLKTIFMARRSFCGGTVPKLLSISSIGESSIRHFSKSSSPRQSIFSCKNQLALSASGRIRSLIYDSLRPVPIIFPSPGCIKIHTASPPAVPVDQLTRTIPAHSRFPPKLRNR